MHGPPTTPQTHDVVVIGGGASGAFLAVQLLRRSPNLSLAVVEKQGLPGRGFAYGTSWPCHLLNVPAGVMSALPDEPTHFLDWVRSNHKPSTDAGRFLPRELYGRYVGSLLEDAAAASPGCFHWIADEVVALRREPRRMVVSPKTGPELTARAVVLASGNLPTRLEISGLNTAPSGKSRRRYVPSGWANAAFENLASTESMLLIGTGLTSVDVAAALRSQGFSGHIHMLSRHGLLPRRYQQTAAPWPPFWNDASPRTIRGLLRLIRAEVRRASASGADWRAVIDSLRPHTQQIWQSLPVDEKKRFLRHARIYWDVHRHRLAPQIDATLRELSRNGLLTIHAGHLLGYREIPRYAEVSFRNRATQATETLRVHRVVNCTGPETDYRRADSPLVCSLFEQGLARPDALALGLDVDARGALLDAEGKPSHSLFCIGPARKGSLWETTAVREIRAQAAELAEELLRQLQRPAPQSPVRAPATSR